MHAGRRVAACAQRQTASLRSPPAPGGGGPGPLAFCLPPYSCCPESAQMLVHSFSAMVSAGLGGAGASGSPRLLSPATRFPFSSFFCLLSLFFGGGRVSFPSPPSELLWWLLASKKAASGGVSKHPAFASRAFPHSVVARGKKPGQSWKVGGLFLFFLNDIFVIILSLPPPHRPALPLSVVGPLISWRVTCGLPLHHLPSPSCTGAK